MTFLRQGRQVTNVSPATNANAIVQQTQWSVIKSKINRLQ